MNTKYKLDLQMFAGEPDRVSVDLTQLSGYAILADGQHTLTVKAKAVGYEDSAASVGVLWTKITPPIVYTITTSIVNGFYSGASTIAENETANVTISASSGYVLPASISVSGASYTYDSTTGIVSLSNPTGNVTISATCPADTPQLDAPTISLSNDTLSIEEVENAECYDLYANNTSVETITHTIQPQWSCVVTGLGSQNPSSVTFTHTGTMPTFEEVTINNNVFIKIPKMYRKVLATSSSQITSFEIANYKKDNNFLLYPCFVKEDGTTEMDYILIGKYCSNSTTVLDSSSTSSTSINIMDARQYTKDMGFGYQLFDWAMYKVWQDLMLCYKQTIKTNDSNGIGTDGYDAFGIYWGSYYCFMDGICSTQDYWYVSYMPSKYQFQSYDRMPETYVQVGYSKRKTYTGALKKLGYDSSNPFVNFPCENTGSNADTDKYYCVTDGSGNGNYSYKVFPNRNAIEGGIFYISTAGWGYTEKSYVRLCYRPV